MRLSTFILLATIMQVSANSFAQKVTLSANNTSLSKVFSEIRKQSGYDFVFTTRTLKNARPVNIDVRNLDINEVLEKIFAGQPLDYKINDKLVVVSKKEPSMINSLITRFQQIDVNGKVVDEKGEPLAGASVMIKGTNRVTKTNESGAFTLTGVNENAILQISYLGYKVREVRVDVEPGIIALEISAGELEEVEVVNTGYQNVSAERLTGAYQKISGEVLAEQVGSSIMERLEAIGNGLSTDRESYSRGRINIRGVSTFSGPGNVLVVLDNFPYEGNLENINPNDVESISILKDAAATSIWGSRAGNGVIVIQTKKGKYNQPLGISANIVNTFKAAPDLYRLPQMNSSDYIDVELQLFKAGFYTSDYNSPGKPVLSPVVELMYDNALSQSQKNALIDGYRNKDVRDDFSRYFYRDSYAQQYYVQAAAGGKGFGWAASSGYDRNRSELNALNDRLSLRYALNFDIVKNLKLDIGLLYTGSNSTSGKTGYGNITSRSGSLYPYASFADADGNPLPIAKDYNTRYINSLAGTKLLDWNYYPLNNDKFQQKKGHQDDLNINAGLNYKWNGLTASVLYRLQRQWGNSGQLQELESYFTRNLINSFTQLNGNSPVYKVPMGAIDDRATARLQARDLRAQLNYTTILGLHGLDVMAGAERREQINTGDQFRSYGFNPNLLSITPVDYLTPFPNYATGSGGYIPDVQQINHTNNRYLSLYGNISYDYKEQYLLYGSARRDATNFFGVNTNDKWKPLWSAGAGWIVSKADFYHLQAVDLLKLRLSYGFSGNADPNQTALTTILYGGVSSYTQSPYANIDKKANPDLKWETVGTTNLGLDFSMLNGRLSGSLDFYIKKAKDLLGVYPIDYTTGVGGFITKNVAAMKGKGVDIALNSINLNGSFKWQSQLNISRVQTKVTNYYLSNTNAADWIGGTTANLSRKIGSPVYSIYAFESPGLDATGDPIAYLNGEVSKDYATITQSGTKLDELKFFGSALPTFFGNFQNRLSYKGFSLQMSVSFKFGYYFRRPSISYNNLVNSGVGHSDYALRWQQPGDEFHTSIPGFVYPNNTSRDVFFAASETLVEKGDHIRFQYANLSYRLPEHLFKRAIRSAEIYANTSNLGILWRANHKGIDPENAGLSSLPPSKTLSAGCRITF